MFHASPSMYLEKDSYDDNDTKKTYSHFDVLPDNNMDPKRLKMVLGQDNYHLFFFVAHRKVKRNEPWAVKIKFKSKLSGPLPKHGVVEVAAMCHVEAVDDGLGAQIKTWFSMESYGTRVIVSGRLRVHEKINDHMSN